MTTKNSQPNIRCGAYVRVNGACQATMSNAFRVQNDAAETFIQSYSHHGWTSIGTYGDVGHSGATMERPSLQRLLADMKAGMVDCVVVSSFDRLTRSMDDQAELIAEFCHHDVTLVTVSPARFVVVGTKVGDSLAEVP